MNEDFKMSTVEYYLHRTHMTGTSMCKYVSVVQEVYIQKTKSIKIKIYLTEIIH